MSGPRNGAAPSLGELGDHLAERDEDQRSGQVGAVEWRARMAALTDVVGEWSCAVELGEITCWWWCSCGERGHRSKHETAAAARRAWRWHLHRRHGQPEPARTPDGGAR